MSKDRLVMSLTGLLLLAIAVGVGLALILSERGSGKDANPATNTPSATQP